MTCSRLMTIVRSRDSSAVEKLRRSRSARERGQRTSTPASPPRTWLSAQRPRCASHAAGLHIARRCCAYPPVAVAQRASAFVPGLQRRHFYSVALNAAASARARRVGHTCSGVTSPAASTRRHDLGAFGWGRCTLAASAASSGADGTRSSWRSRGSWCGTGWWWCDGSSSRTSTTQRLRAGRRAREQTQRSRAGRLPQPLGGGSARAWHDGRGHPRARHTAGSASDN